MISGRAGLVMDAGSKVTYNGVEIGGSRPCRRRRATVCAARITMNVNPVT